MNNFISDIWSILSSLSIVDYILYFSVVTLISLVVSLIYIIQNEKYEKNDEENLDNVVSSKNKSEESKEENVLKEKVEKGNDEIDLQNIINTIDENPKPLVDMTAYEEEQEQKAIISYEELLKESSKQDIHYVKEELVDDVIPVKKISLDSPCDKEISFIAKEPILNLTSDIEKSSVKLFSYEKEEAFLKALQQLGELLN